jgi:hypothetical protein
VAYENAAAPEADAAECVRRLARLIAGTDNFPAWLPAALEFHGGSLLHLRERLREQQLRDRGNTRLLRVQQEMGAVRLILADLDDFDTTSSVSAASWYDPEADTKLYFALKERLHRLEITATRLSKKKGRPRSPAHIACALMVAGTWFEVHGKAPGHTSVRANDACNLLWQLGGGGRPQQNSNNFERWRDHLKRATDDRLRLVEAITRTIRGGAKWSKTLE